LQRGSREVVIEIVVVVVHVHLLVLIPAIIRGGFIGFDIEFNYLIVLEAGVTLPYYIFGILFIHVQLVSFEFVVSTLVEVSVFVVEFLQVVGVRHIVLRDTPAIVVIVIFLVIQVHLVVSTSSSGSSLLNTSS